VPVAVATLEEVILSKFQLAHLGGSRQQLGDVATLIRVRREEIDRTYLDRWVAALGLDGEWTAALQLLGGDG
jgi:hypothetical protein